MLKPQYPAAVVAGNVETSQVVTDCLYGALGVLAASQGTMNNFTFGDGARSTTKPSPAVRAPARLDGTSSGPDAHDELASHDPEVLEWRFPVRLEDFRIRRGSGGAGRHRGGDGSERRVRFLTPMTAVLLANHRVVAPFGLSGGHPGATGRNWIERVDGSVEQFGATHSAEVNAGDVFVIQTPGGGGFAEQPRTARLATASIVGTMPSTTTSRSATRSRRSPSIACSFRPSSRSPGPSSRSRRSRSAISRARSVA